MQGTGEAKPRPLDWDACVEAFGVAHRERLADWRRFSGEFVSWLHKEKLIGISNGALAFAVHKGGHIVGCHYRPRDGKDWFYYPKGINAAPLVFGEILEGDTIHCFEHCIAKNVRVFRSSGERRAQVPLPMTC